MHELFSGVEGREVPAELEELTQSARRQLRQVFLEADVGITGANFVVAETGSVVTVTNEGNGRLVASLPKVHIAITGIERLVPTIAELAPLLQLLGRSGTGQRLTSYTHVVTGPRRAGEEDGPEELHVVFLENGRRNLMGTKYEEMLACIRCGACLNVCPVFRKTAGEAYGPVYSGPDGGGARTASRRARATRRRFRTPPRSAARARRPARSRSRCTSCCSSCAETSSSSTSPRGASARP